MDRVQKFEHSRCAAAESCKHKHDILFTQFRNDIAAEAVDRFARLGLKMDKLKHWQKQYPFIYPWNSEYDYYRTNVNRRFVVFPLIIAMCEKDCDVVKALAIAQKYKIPLSVRGGSHCMEGYSLIDGIVIDQSRRTKVSVHSGNIVEVEPGVLLGPMIYKLTKYNLIIPCGSCPNVCAAGLTLGGGLGFLTHMYGYTSDNLIGAKVLLANGKMVTCNTHKHNDLFFALRGAGLGNYGIVTHFTYRAHHLKHVIMYRFDYPFSLFGKMLNRWQKFVLRNMDNLNWGSEFRANNGSSCPYISGVVRGSLEEAETLLCKFSRLASGKLIRKVKYTEAAREFAAKLDGCLSRNVKMALFENHSRHQPLT